MTGRGLFCLAVALAAASVFADTPARAADTIYEYHIEHPTYGDIGTYSNVVKRLGDHFEVDTKLHVAVKLLGIVVHSEDATRSEIWRGDRLMRFDGITDINGTNVKIHGEARGDAFVVTTPEGTVTALANVHPSNPWRVKVLDTDVMMSTKSGRVVKVTVSNLGIGPVTFDGKAMRLRRYDIVDTSRQSVWFDDRGTPVAFRTVDDNTPIDFILSAPPAGEAASNAQN